MTSAGGSGRLRLRIALSLSVVVPLGFATRLTAGPAAGWARDAAGGVLYEVFWCLVLQGLLPRAKPWRIALGVLAGTCALEFLQLWHPPFLEALRAHFLGRIVLGHTFAWWDLPPYLFGSALGYGWLTRMTATPEEARQRM